MSDRPASSYAEFLEGIRRADDDPARRGSPSPTGCRYFDYSPGQPNLYLLMRFKQALVAEFGVEDGFRRYRETVPVHARARLEKRRLDSQAAFARVGAASFTELAPAGEAFTVPPPRVVGPGNHRPLAGTTRAFYVTCLADARLRGRSETVAVADRTLIDFQGPELSRIDDEIEFDPAIFHRAGDVACEIAPGEAALEIDEAFTLLGAHSDFFGHWMWEYLPRYVAATQSGLLPPVPILIDAHMPPAHRQALEMLRDGPAPIVEVAPFASLRVRRLWCAPNLMYMPLHERSNARFKWDYMASAPARFAPVIDEMTRRADLVLGGAGGPARVFLARRDFRHRRLVNRGAIEAIAERRDFVLAYPEDLDFVEQVRLLRNARNVVAPEGSALFLAFFARTGVRLCILNHPATEGLAIYQGLLAGKRADITVVTGPAVKQHHELAHYADYRIDEDRFAGFLDAWLAGDDGRDAAGIG